MSVYGNDKSEIQEGLLNRQFGISEEENFILEGDQAQYMRDPYLKCKHVKLDVAFALEKRQVIGTVKLTFNTSTPISEITLDSLDTEIHAIRYKSSELTFRKFDDKLTIFSKMLLPTEVDFDITIDFTSTPRRGLYFVTPTPEYPDKTVQIWTQGQDVDHHFWFPCIDQPFGRLTSEVICTVPSNWTVVSNGIKLFEKVEGSQKVVHWKQSKPHALYLISLVAGEMVHIPLTEKPYPIDLYTIKGKEEDTKRSFENTIPIMELLEKRLGVPYPWDKYTQVMAQDFIFGGMENTSATTQTDRVIHDEKAHRDYDADNLIVHEAMHQWFGDLVTVREWAHGWLHEGFATFSETLWMEHKEGQDGYIYEVICLANDYLDEEYSRAIVERRYNAPIDIFDRHLYEKAGVVIHMLRRELGDDTFFKVIKEYLVRNTNNNVKTEHFSTIVEEISQRNFDRFFDQWIFQKGHPKLKVDYEWSENTKIAQLKVIQEQTLPFQMNLDVKFIFADKTELLKKISIHKKTEVFNFKLATEPKSVSFDSGYSVLKELEFKLPIEMLTFQLENDKDIASRLFVVNQLGKENGLTVVRSLARALDKDSSWQVQAAAAESLGGVRGELALQELCKQIEHPHLKVRKAVATSLGKFKYSKVAFEALSKMLDQKDSYFVAQAAASSLGRVDAEKAHSKLLKTLKRSSFREVIASGAIAGISLLNTDEALKTVLDHTQLGFDQSLRFASTVALSNFTIARKKIVAELIFLLQDDWFLVRSAAMSGLAQLAATEAVPHLEKIVDSSLDYSDVRKARVTKLAIQKRLKPNEKIKNLTKEVDKLRSENSKIVERLEKLEKSDKVN